MRAKISTGRRVIGGLVGLIALASGCVSTSKLIDQPEAQPRYSSEIETEYKGEADEFVSRIEVGEGRNKLLRLEHTDGNVTKKRIGARANINSPSFSGYIDVFATNDSTNNWGEGVNIDGKINKLILGGAAERTEVAGIENKVINAYTGVDLLDSHGVIFTVGGARLEQGGDKNTIHGNLLVHKGNFVTGIGGQIDSLNDEYAHFVAGKYPETKGQGFGWRLYGLSEFEGDVALDLVLAWNANFDKWFYLGTFARNEYFHERKMRIANNIMDYFVPNTPLYRRSKGMIATNFKFSHAGGKNTLDSNVVVYPAGIIGKLGQNSWFDNLWVGFGHNTSSGDLTGSLGIQSPDGKLVIYGSQIKGKKPYVFAGANLKF